MKKAEFERNIVQYRLVNDFDRSYGDILNPSDKKKKSQVTSLFYSPSIVAKCHPTENDVNGFRKIKLTLINDNWVHLKTGEVWKVKGI